MKLHRKPTARLTKNINRLKFFWQIIVHDAILPNPRENSEKRLVFSQCKNVKKNNGWFLSFASADHL